MKGLRLGKTGLCLQRTATTPFPLATLTLPPPRIAFLVLYDADQEKLLLQARASTVAPVHLFGVLAFRSGNMSELWKKNKTFDNLQSLVYLVP